MEEKKIRVFHTHIEISPYELGENEKLERQLSLWIEAEFRFDPFCYHIENDTLFIPRGINLIKLEKMFDSTPVIIREADAYKTIRGVHMTSMPRDRIQEEAIDFLSSEGEFKNTLPYSQQALILDTGDGKTYTTTHSILNLKMRAIIITHQDKIKQQWIKTFINHTDINPDKLININNSSVIRDIMKNKVEGYIYFVNHQTLNSYGETNGWDKLRNFFKKISVGIKVFDEAHLSFRNVVKVDMFSNCVKTFYLTANFDRSDQQESYLFKKAFASVYKFGEHTKDYEEKRKHIIYVPVLYRSRPSYEHLKMAKNMYGFSVLGFSNYALHCDEEQTMMRIFLSILDMSMRIEGKILVTTPRIEDTYMLKERIEKEYVNNPLFVSTINSKNSKSENDIAKKADIICSTIKSCGTGVDIPGLRCIINLEPFSSSITANQLSGRLREYAKDKDTFFFDLIDIAFPTCENQYKTKLTHLKKKCKEIRVMKK